MTTDGRYLLQDHMDLSNPILAGMLAKNGEDEKRGFHRFTTGPCVVRFFNLHEARDFQGNGKFNYDCELLFTDAKAQQMQEFIDVLHQIVADTHPKVKRAEKARPPYTIDPDDADGNEIEGALAVKFKVAATWPGGDASRQPVFYNGDAEVIEPVLAFGGSVVNVNFEVRDVFHQQGSLAGLRLEPAEVQILEIAKRQAPAARSTGFDTRGTTGSDDAAPATRGNF